MNTDIKKDRNGPSKYLLLSWYVMSSEVWKCKLIDIITTKIDKSSYNAKDRRFIIIGTALKLSFRIIEGLNTREREKLVMRARSIVLGVEIKNVYPGSSDSENEEWAIRPMD